MSMNTINIERFHKAYDKGRASNRVIEVQTSRKVTRKLKRLLGTLGVAIFVAMVLAVMILPFYVISHFLVKWW